MAKDNLIYLILLVIVEIFGDFSLEKYANMNKNDDYKNTYLFFGCIFYVGVIYFLIKSLEGSHILYVNAMWDGISALIESLSAMIFLGEYFDNYTQNFGLIFLILGLFLVKNTNPFYIFYENFKL